MRRLAMVFLVACSSSSSTERTYTLDELDLSSKLGLPVTGDGTLVVSKSLIDPPDWSKVTGHATFQCNDCTVGDDHKTLQATGGLELQFGHVLFKHVEGRAEVAGGHVHATAKVASPDLELAARIDGTLAKKLEDSDVTGCIAFRPTEALRTRDPKMFALLSITGAEQDDKGWFHIALEGHVKDMKRLARPCEP